MLFTVILRSVRGHRAFSALTFLVRCQEEQPACKQLDDEVLAG